MSSKVNPFGEIKNTTDSGTLMVNRGQLKVEQDELVDLSRCGKPSWIYCSIDKKFAPNAINKGFKSYGAVKIRL